MLANLNSVLTDIGTTFVSHLLFCLITVQNAEHCIQVKNLNSDSEFAKGDNGSLYSIWVTLISGISNVPRGTAGYTLISPFRR